MNLIVDIIGYIGAAFIGAVCLELFWYERRRRQHKREELEVPEGPAQNYCGYCGRKFKQDEDGGWFPCACAMDWAVSQYEDDNPPPVPGEKKE